jgi:hypothetical protein
VRALSPLRLPGTPHDPNARPQHSPVSRTRASCRRRHSAAIASRYRRQTVSRRSTLQTAATSGAIDQSTSQRRHQHPNHRSLARRLEPASPVRPDHRQRPIPIARAPDPRLRSTRLLCNPAFRYCPVDCALKRDRAEPSIILVNRTPENVNRRPSGETDKNPNQPFYDKTGASLRDLFVRAKASQELHFVMALKPEFRGTQGSGWSTAHESVPA